VAYRLATGRRCPCRAAKANVARGWPLCKRHARNAYIVLSLPADAMRLAMRVWTNVRELEPR
jgi:hypothetical protein